MHKRKIWECLRLDPLDIDSKQKAIKLHTAQVKINVALAQGLQQSIQYPYITCGSNAFWQQDYEAGFKRQSGSNY